MFSLGKSFLALAPGASAVILHAGMQGNAVANNTLQPVPVINQLRSMVNVQNNFNRTMELEIALTQCKVDCDTGSCRACKECIVMKSGQARDSLARSLEGALTHNINKKFYKADIFSKNMQKKHCF